MGYRLHFAKTFKVEYGGGAFSHSSLEFATMVHNEFDDAYNEEDTDNYEIVPADLQAYVDKLKKLAPNGKHKYMPEYKNKEVLDYLQEILNGYDKSNDYIRLEWF